MKFFFALFLTAATFFSSTSFSLWADYTAFETLLKKAKKENLALPKPQFDGRYQTLNKKGAALPVTNIITDEFIAYASQDNKHILHVDAQFGHIALDVLKSNVAEYVATDSDKRHLAVIAKRANKLIPTKNLKALKLFHGSFPNSFKEFADNSFDVILLDRVLHFYTPDQVTKAIKETLRILKPGGKVFIVAITPYVRRFESFIPQYKQRLLLKHRYPGHVKNLKYFANPEVTTPEQLNQMHDKSFMFFDAQFMHFFLSKTGFVVDKAFEFALGFKSITWALDGRELVGAVARKPLARPSFPAKAH